MNTISHTLSAAASDTVQQTTTSSLGYAKLVESKLCDSSAYLLEQTPPLLAPTQECRQNIHALLHRERDSNLKLITIIRAILSGLTGKCYFPIIYGLELKSVLGWDFISSGYLHLVRQKHPDATLEECLDPGTVAVTKRSCTKPAEQLFVRIMLHPQVQDPKRVVETLHTTLKPLLKDTLGDVIHHEPTVSFCYTSTLQNRKQEIVFEFATQLAYPFATISESMQILLNQSLEPVIIDNNAGNQWFVDTMLRVVKKVYEHSGSTAAMIRHMLQGYDTRGPILDTVAASCRSLNSLFTMLPRRPESAIALCQAAYALNKEEAIVPFLESLEPFESTCSLWPAALALLKSKAVSYKELELLLSFLGLAATQLETDGPVVVAIGAPLDSPVLSFETDSIFTIAQPSKHSFVECEELITRLENNELFGQLVAAFFQGAHKRRKECMALDVIEPIDSAKNPLFALIMSLFVPNSPLFSYGLQELYSKPQSTAAKTVLETCLALEGLNIANASELIEALLTKMPALGTKLALELDDVALKCRLIKTHPELTLSLVPQIENAPEITEQDVRSWLQTGSEKTKSALWGRLVQGKWQEVAIASCPEYFVEACTTPAFAKQIAGNSPERIFNFLATLQKMNREDAIKPFLGQITPCSPQDGPHQAALSLVQQGACTFSEIEPLVVVSRPFVQCQALTRRLQNDTAYNLLIEYAIKKGHPSAKELLQNLDNHVELKCSWIAKHPEEILEFAKALVDDPKISERTVREWLNKVPEADKKALWQALMQSRWLKLAAVLCPHFLEDAFGSEPIVGGIVTALPTNGAYSAEFRTLIVKQAATKNRLESAPELVVQVICHTTSQPLRKELVEHAEAIGRPDLAMRLLSTSQHILDESDKETILRCMKTAMPREIVDWYLSIAGSKLSYKYQPAVQLHILANIAEEHPNAVEKVKKEYVHELSIRIQAEERKALQQQLAFVKKHPLFAEFFAVKAKNAPQPVQPAPKRALPTVDQLLKGTGEPSDAEEVVCTLLKSTKEHALISCFRLLAKYPTLNPRYWTQAFNASDRNVCTDAIATGIGLLIHCSATMTDDAQRGIWRVVLSNSGWLASRQALPLFTKLELFKRLFSEPANNKKGAETNKLHLADAVSMLVQQLKQHPEYLTHAYRWYELIPQDSKQKLELGLELVQYCTNSEALDETTQIVQKLLPLLGSLPVAHKASRKAQPQGQTLQALVPFLSCAAKAKKISQETETTLCQLIQFLGKKEAIEFHQFALRQFVSFDTLTLVEALWPSVRRGLDYISQIDTAIDQFSVDTAIILNKLLKGASAEIMLDIYAKHYPVREGTVVGIEASQTLLEAYPRLLRLSIESKTPEHVKRACLIDTTINKCYPNQARVVKKYIESYDTLRIQLMLRLIQYHGWSDTTKIVLETYVNQCTVFYTGCIGKRFYSSCAYSEKAFPDLKIGSITPKAANELADIPEIHLYIYSSLRFAHESAQDIGQRNRLLDFALQSIRNMLAYYPETNIYFDYIQQLAQLIAPTDPIFSAHANIILGLLRTCVQKQVVGINDPTLKELLSYIQKDVTDLTSENLEPLHDIRKALAAVTAQNAEEVILEQQNALVLWQDLHFVSAYQERQHILDQVYALWKRYPEVAKKKSFVYSISQVITPTARCFGHDKEDIVLDAYEGHLGCFISIYNSIVAANKSPYSQKTKHSRDVLVYKFSDEGKFASECLATIVDEFSSAVALGCYKNSPERLVATARLIMPLFRAPTYLNSISMAGLAGTLSNCLLSIPHLALRQEIVHEWLTVLSSHRKESNFNSIEHKAVEQIVHSTLPVHFTLEQHKTLASCLTNFGKNKLLLAHEKRLEAKGPFDDVVMHQLAAIYMDIVAENPRGALAKAPEKSAKKAQITITLSEDGQLALRSLKCLSMGLKRVKRESFVGHLRVVMQLFKNPCYLGFNVVTPYVANILEAIVGYIKNPAEEMFIVHEWLQVLLTHRKGTGYMTNLFETMDRFIRGNLIAHFKHFGTNEHETLITCLEDWQTSGIPISDELIQLLYLQQKGDEFLQGLDKLVELIDKLDVNEK